MKCAIALLALGHAPRLEAASLSRETSPIGADTRNGKDKMRALPAILAVSMLAACAAPGPRMPQNIEPIVGVVTFGVRPVEQAEHLQAFTLTQSRGGGSISATIETRSIADIKRTASEFIVHLEVVDAGVLGEDESLDELRQEVRELPGAKFTYTKDLRTGKESHKIRTSSFDVDAVQARASALTTMIAEGYMGGGSVVQNQEVTVAAPKATPQGEHLTVTSRVAGRTVHAGRPAIAFAVNGRAAAGGKDFDVSGIVIVDIETGACVFSELTTSGIPMGRATGTITVTQRLTIF